MDFEQRRRRFCQDLTISIDEVVAQTLYNVATRMTPRYASEPMQCQTLRMN